MAMCWLKVGVGFVAWSRCVGSSPCATVKLWLEKKEKEAQLARGSVEAGEERKRLLFESEKRRWYREMSVGCLPFGTLREGFFIEESYR